MIRSGYAQRVLIGARQLARDSDEDFFSKGLCESGSVFKISAALPPYGSSDVRVLVKKTEGLDQEWGLGSGQHGEVSAARGSGQREIQMKEVPVL